MIAPGSHVLTRGMPYGCKVCCVADPFPHNFPQGTVAQIEMGLKCFVVAVLGEWIGVYNPELTDSLIVWIHNRYLQEVV